MGDVSLSLLFIWEGSRLCSFNWYSLQKTARIDVLQYPADFIVFLTSL